MRALFMDFPDDPKVADLRDEYMFGPAFLVAPVTEQGATSRAVYLPAGADWYNYWTNERVQGGQTIKPMRPSTRFRCLFAPDRSCRSGTRSRARARRRRSPRCGSIQARTPTSRSIRTTERPMPTSTGTAASLGCTGMMPRTRWNIRARRPGPNPTLKSWRWLGGKKEISSPGPRGPDVVSRSRTDVR